MGLMMWKRGGGYLPTFGNRIKQGEESGPVGKGVEDKRI